MDDKTKKRFKIAIIVIIVLILICFSVLVVLRLVDKNTYKEEGVLDDTYITINNPAKKELSKEVFADDYFTIKSCLNMYYDDINSFTDSTNVIPNEEIAKSIISKLNNSYVQDKNLTIDKIINYYSNYKYTEFLIEDVYENEYDNSICVYIMFGKEINQVDKTSRDYGFIVTIDWQNNMYSVVPYEYMQEKELDNIDNFNTKQGNIDLLTIKEDELNGNTINRQSVNNEDLISNIFREYRQFCKFDEKHAYRLLNEKYREKRFVSQAEGEKYLKNNIPDILGTYISKMSTKTIDDNTTQYICIDNKGYYFIITLDNFTTNYSVVLDIYTIPVEEFTKAYNNSNDYKKCVFNAEKFQQMINFKDYASAYNVLDENFRNNNFGSIENFRAYIESNWPEYIKISYKEYNDSGELGLLSVNISSRDDVNQSIQKTFIIKLIDENTFTMSFNIE